MAAAGVNALSRETQVIEVVGRLDSDHAQRLLCEAESALARGVQHLVLDLSGVQFINSAGLRALVEIFKHAERRRRHLSVLNPSDRVEKVLALVGLEDVLPIVRDLARGQVDEAPREVSYGA